MSETTAAAPFAPAPWRPKRPPAPPWWRITIIFPRLGKTGDVFLYSVNFSRRGGPEFLAFLWPGANSKHLNATLNSLCLRWQEDGAIPLGEDLHGHHFGPVRLLEAPRTVHDRYTCQAWRLAFDEQRPIPRVLQVVLADDEGRWPWEPGCTCPQRVLGERVLQPLDGVS